MLSVLRLALTGLALWVVASAYPAMAAWKVLLPPYLDDPGDSALLVGELDANTTLFARCRGGEITIGLLSKDGRDGPPAEVGAVNLQILPDTGRVWVAPATYERKTPGYLTLTYGSSRDARPIINDIIGAKAEIPVVIEFVDTGDLSSWIADAKNSTKAGRAFLAACSGEDQPMTPQTTVAATGGSLPWELTVEPDPVNGGDSVSLVGDLDQGGYFYAYCSASGAATMAFLSNNPATFPYGPRDVDADVHVEIDAQEWFGPASYYEHGGGYTGFDYANRGDIETIIGMIAGARDDVAMLVDSHSSGMVTRWPAKGLGGAAQAAKGFVDHCFRGAAPPTVTAQPVAQPATNAPPQQGWQTRAGKDVGAPDAAGVLDAATDPAMGFLRLMCAKDGTHWWIGFMSFDKPGFPVKAGQALPAVYVTADANVWWLPQTFFVDNKEFTGIFTENEQIALEFLSMTVLQPSSVTVRLEGDGEPRVYDIPLSGALTAITDLYAHCYPEPKQ